MIAFLKKFDLFDNFCGKVQLKKSKLEELGVPEELVRPYAEKETDKMFECFDEKVTVAKKEALD